MNVLRLFLGAVLPVGVAFISLAHAEASENVSPELKFGIVKKTTEVFARLDEMFAKSGYPFEKPTGDIMVRQNHDPVNQRDELNLSMGHDLDMRFLPESMEIIHFFNALQERKATRDGNQLRIFPQKPQPTLSKDTVVQIATQFTTAVLGKFPANLGKASVRWDTPYGMARAPFKAPVYQHGLWRVFWPRVSEQGYEFPPLESVGVELYEDIGPVALHASMVMQFDKVDFTPLKQEDVLDVARSSAQEVTQWKPTKDMFEGLILDPKPLASKLRIVRPNHLTKHDEIPAGGDVKGRLAWDIWFACYGPGQAHESSKARCYLCVWVDAQNKEFLGGDIQGR